MLPQGNLWFSQLGTAVSPAIKDFFIDYFYFEYFDINNFIHIDLFESLFYVLKVVLIDRYLIVN